VRRSPLPLPSHSHPSPGTCFLMSGVLPLTTVMTTRCFALLLVIAVFSFTAHAKRKREPKETDPLLVLASTLEKSKWDAVYMSGSCADDTNCCFITVCGKKSKEYFQKCVMDMSGFYPVKFDRSEAGAVDSIITSKGYKQLIPFRAEFTEWWLNGRYHCQFRVTQNGYYQKE